MNRTLGTPIELLQQRDKGVRSNSGIQKMDEPERSLGLNLGTTGFTRPRATEGVCTVADKGDGSCKKIADIDVDGISSLRSGGYHRNLKKLEAIDVQAILSRYYCVCMFFCRCLKIRRYTSPVLTASCMVRH